MENIVDGSTLNLDSKPFVPQMAPPSNCNIVDELDSGEAQGIE